MNVWTISNIILLILIHTHWTKTQQRSQRWYIRKRIFKKFSTFDGQFWNFFKISKTSKDIFNFPTSDVNTNFKFVIFLTFWICYFKIPKCSKFQKHMEFWRSTIQNSKISKQHMDSSGDPFKIVIKHVEISNPQFQNTYKIPKF